MGRDSSSIAGLIHFAAGFDNGGLRRGMDEDHMIINHQVEGVMDGQEVGVTGN